VSRIGRPSEYEEAMINFTVSVPTSLKRILDEFCAQHNISRSKAVIYMLQDMNTDLVETNITLKLRIKELEECLQGHKERIVTLEKQIPNIQKKLVLNKSAQFCEDCGIYYKSDPKNPAFFTRIHKKHKCNTHSVHEEETNCLSPSQASSQSNSGAGSHPREGDG